MSSPPKDEEIFCFDASAFIQLKNFYKGKVFEFVWSGFEEDQQAGIIKAPKEVLLELKEYQDFLSTWADSRKHIFVAFDNEQMVRLRQVLKALPKLHDTKKRKLDADPLVVALAMARNMTVVTGELGTRGINIAGACKSLKIKCLTLQNFLDRRNYKKN